MRETTKTDSDISKEKKKKSGAHGFIKELETQENHTQLFSFLTLEMVWTLFRANPCLSLTHHHQNFYRPCPAQSLTQTSKHIHSQYFLLPNSFVTTHQSQQSDERGRTEKTQSTERHRRSEKTSIPRLSSKEVLCATSTERDPLYDVP